MLQSPLVLSSFHKKRLQLLSSGILNELSIWKDLFYWRKWKSFLSPRKYSCLESDTEDEFPRKGCNSKEPEYNDEELVSLKINKENLQHLCQQYPWALQYKPIQNSTGNLSAVYMWEVLTPYKYNETLALLQSIFCYLPLAR